MGQTLSEPVTAKETTCCCDDRVYVGASCMQGWRINMEDSHTHILSLSPDDPDASFFAVYDGHGGDKVAHYAGNHLHKKIVSHMSYANGNIEEAIRLGFLQLDADMLSDPEMRDELAGTTAVCMLMKNNRLYIGNVGDSRAVACWGGRVDPLSLDHKPSNELEAKRIVAAGGWVDFN
ncbi:phosphatase 2C-like protein, partial [Leptotrombidium deliense]